VRREVSDDGPTPRREFRRESITRVCGGFRRRGEMAMANCTHPVVRSKGSVTAYDTASVAASSRVTFTQTYDTATSPTVGALITDSTGGAAAAAIAAGVGISVVSLPINLASVADGDVLTAFTPGFKFKILSLAFAVTVPVTTGSKATTLNMEIGTTNLTGGALALTSANCTPIGAVVAASAVTAANTGSAAATVSVEASSTTAFVEGAGVLLVTIQNMDTADAFATLLSEATASKKVANALIDTAQAFGYAL